MLYLVLYQVQLLPPELLLLSQSCSHLGAPMPGKLLLLDLLLDQFMLPFSELLARVDS